MSKQKALIALTQELSKENPNKKTVKELMELCGLKFSQDPVEQLKTVLMATQKSTTIKSTKDLEQ